MMKSDHTPAAGDGQRTPSRRDVLRYGTVAAPGVVALVSLGVITFGIGAAEAKPLAVRREIGEMARKDPARFRKLRRALAIMQRRSARNAADPAGWLANAQAHFDGCTISNDMSPAEARRDPNQVHYCWWFLPWHRAYLSVTEKKIQEIAEDATIGLPYWNWSVERTLPAAYARTDSSLFHKERYGPAVPLDDEIVGFDPKLYRRGFGVAALAEKRFWSNPGKRSFGGSPRPRKDDNYVPGALELVPHNPIHDKVGGERIIAQLPYYGDMGDLATAARDPVFFAHHGNIDRLWEIWRQDPKRRATEPKNKKVFVDHTFVFKDLRGLPLEVRVGDTLDTRKLGFRYDSLDVFDGRTPPRVAPQAREVAQAGGAAVSRRVPITRGPGSGFTLTIEDIETADRAVTFRVFVGPASGASRDEPVGVVSVVLNRGIGTLPVVWIDVTDAVARLPSSAPAAMVTMVADSADGLPPPSIAVGAMQIRSED